MIIFLKPNRRVHTVFIHCSASDYKSHDKRRVVDEWHRDRGYNCIGYHYYIRKSGLIETGRDIELKPAAQYGHNSGTIAICCGGLKMFPVIQMRSLYNLCHEINSQYNCSIRFRGHCEVGPDKECPVFDYKNILHLDDNGNMGTTKNKRWRY